MSEDNQKAKSEFEKGIVSIEIINRQLTHEETMQAFEDFCQGETLSPDGAGPLERDLLEAAKDLAHQLVKALDIAHKEFARFQRNYMDYRAENQRQTIPRLCSAEQSVDELREELQRKDLEIASLKAKSCTATDAMLMKALDRQNGLTRKVSHYHRLYQKEKGKAGRYLRSLLHTNIYYLKFRNNEWRLERSKSILDDALLSIECCYDSDGNSMKHSDAAIKLRAAIKLIKEF